ncbi:hypothetical protein EII19_00635 [Comamonadaceae bacterium OH2310_COT-174]|nr:hypothetical protein EII19_00635 [Comamonadaceae bacterium OH2310_COT-174]
MSRLKELRIVDPVLTNLATGYSGNEYIGHHLLPFVPVEKEAGQIPRFGKEAFVESRTERAIRADSNLIDPEGVGLADFTLTEHDIGQPIDYREEQESNFALEAWATHVVTEKIRLRHEIKVARLVQNTASYPASNRITLSGSDQFTHADSDPEGVIDDAKDAISAAVGREPNTMVIGQAAWRALKRHPKLKAILSDTRTRLVQLADLREIFEVEHIVVGKGVQAATPTSPFTRIWGDNIVLAYVSRGAGGQRTVYDPSFGYTPQKKGWPQVDKYALPGGKVQVVRSTDIFEPFILGADAGYLIADTNA